MDFKNMDTFTLQRKSANALIVVGVVAFATLAARWGWVILVPVAILNLLLGGNQDVAYGTLIFAFFFYLSSFAIKKALVGVVQWREAIDTELGTRPNAY